MSFSTISSPLLLLAEKYVLCVKSFVLSVGMAMSFYLCSVSKSELSKVVPELHVPARR